MKLLTFALFILASFSSQAEGLEHCYKAIHKHVSEAIAHNLKLDPTYSELSEGRSHILSMTLVFYERLSIFAVKNIERESLVYQKKGIALLCDELADMKNLPDFQNNLPVNLRPTLFHSYNSKVINSKLKLSLQNDDLKKAYDDVASDLYELESFPNQLCMTRHILESIGRTLLLADEHREKAKKLGLPDPISTIKKFISLQRNTLGLAHNLDEKAFPLQRDGILLFCQDVPAISWK
jgi:hypothetical protein